MRVARIQAELALIRMGPLFLALWRKWENVVHERMGHLMTLGFMWRLYAGNERVVRRWFYTRGCPGCVDYTPCGNLCECHIGLPPSIPRTEPDNVWVSDVMGDFY